jgi:5-methyltetrahydropteroyltriglutamate--homocysteine methyltransferase
MHWSFDEYYNSRRECAEAFSAAIAAEVAVIAAAGVQEIQIDEPALGAVPAETSWAAHMLGEVAAQRGSARLWAQVGFGDPEPDWDALAGLPVDCLMIGLAHQGLAGADGLAALAGQTTLVAGVVDAIDPVLETVDEIRDRVEQVLRRIPSEHLMLAPDAGLRSLPPALAADKVVRLVEVAAGF